MKAFIVCTMSTSRRGRTAASYFLTGAKPHAQARSSVVAELSGTAHDVVQRAREFGVLGDIHIHNVDCDPRECERI